MFIETLLNKILSSFQERNVVPDIALLKELDVHMSNGSINIEHLRRCATATCFTFNSIELTFIVVSSSAKLFHVLLWLTAQLSLPWSQVC